MIDQFDRTIDYLRLSVTEQCNLHCCYCRPGGVCSKRGSAPAPLSLLEMYELCGLFAELGITRIKVTGGEPLLRPGALSLMRRLKQLDGIRSVTLTTNGIGLREAARELADLGIDGVNVSLDTFQPEVFSAITGVKDGKAALDIIFGGIRQAIRLGIPLKINTVLMEGKNDGEIASFLQAVRKWPIAVRFIEMMPIGEGAHFSAISGEEIRRQLLALEPGLRLCEKFQEAFLEKSRPGYPVGNGPAVYYDAEGWQGRIGFIGAVTEPFCQSCTRIRLTSDGKLRLCLAHEDGLDLAAMIREGKSREAMKRAIREAVYRKPAAHPFAAWKEKKSCGMEREMWQIGG